MTISEKTAPKRSLCGHSLAEQHNLIIPIQSKIIIKSERYLREEQKYYPEALFLGQRML
jgi:hypothetical protein